MDRSCNRKSTKSVFLRWKNFKKKYSQEELSAEEYGKSRRAHWGIENSLHWGLNIGFREDESRIRAGNAAKNVNIVRYIAIV